MTATDFPAGVANVYLTVAASLPELEPERSISWPHIQFPLTSKVEAGDDPLGMLKDQSVLLVEETV